MRLRLGNFDFVVMRFFRRGLLVVSVSLKVKKVGKIVIIEYSNNVVNFLCLVFVNFKNCILY